MKLLLSAIALCCLTVASAEHSISRIAFGSCAMQTKAQPIWDNHDYGKHDGGAEFELKALTKSFFLDFFEGAKETTRRKTPGIYDAKVFGPKGQRVQVILLDTRWFKGPSLKDKRSTEEKRAAGLSGSMGKYLPNSNPDVTLLGEAQWRWLEQQLMLPADVRLIVSSTQVIADQKHMDEWGNYPLERMRLFELIASTHAESVIILSGNVHFAELSKLEAGVYPLFDFTSSGLTHTNEAYAAAANLYRVAGPYDGLNFGIVEIDWDAKPAPVINLAAMNINGEAVFEHRLPLSQLKRN